MVRGQSDLNQGNGGALYKAATGGSEVTRQGVVGLAALSGACAGRAWQDFTEALDCTGVWPMFAGF